MTGPEAVVVQWRPARGPARRVEFEPTESGYLRVEREWSGCRWRTVGREPVDSVHFDGLDADRRAETASHSYRGP